MTRVLAIVLTFNAPEALGQAVRGIAAQGELVGHTLVVDNASRVPVDVGQLAEATGLRPGSLEVLRLPENTGPAGGHAAGLARFLELGEYTHAWVMDDDVAPGPGCLAGQLALAAGLPAASAVYPQVVDVATGRVENYPGWFGLLLPRPVVERAGVPRADFFWWAEDTEYLHHRLPGVGVGVHSAPDAVIRHSGVRRTPVRPPWKVYYETRNTIYYRWHVQGHRAGAVRLMAWSLIRLGAAASRGPGRGPRLAAYGRGLADGVRGRLGKTMEP
ncbi:MAG: glycosyltransferase [Actinomycetes bacterium]